MLSSFTEFKRRKDSTKTVDSVFNHMENDIAAVYIDPQRVNKIINLYSDWAESLVVGEKTLREHRILKELPITIKEISLDAATAARRIVKKHRYQFVEYTALSPVDNAEVHIDRILNNLKDDLIRNFGVSPKQQQPVPQQQQNPTWWDRLKRAARGLWYGPGDPNMRKAAHSQGFQDYYTPRESVEPELNLLFEGVIKESIATLVQILAQYKQQLLDVIQQSIDYHDALKSHYGSYRPAKQEPAAPTAPEAPAKGDEDGDDWDEIQSDDRVPEIGDATMYDFPVKDAVPPNSGSPKAADAPAAEVPTTDQPKAEVPPEATKEPEAEVPKEPEVPLAKEPKAPTVPKERKPRGRVKGKAYLTKVEENGDLTFENKDGESTTVNYKDVAKNKYGVPITVDITGSPHSVLGTEFKKLANHLIPPEQAAAKFPTKKPVKVAEPDPNEPEEAKLSRATAKPKIFDNKDIEKNFKMEAGKPVFIKNGLPVTNKVPHKNYFYLEVGKVWYMVSKNDWEKFVGKAEKVKPDSESDSESEESEKPDYSHLVAAKADDDIPRSKIDYGDDDDDDDINDDNFF